MRRQSIFGLAIGDFGDGGVIRFTAFLRVRW